MVTLVTGGTGFVGSNIVKALAMKGHSIICLDIAAPNAMVTAYLEPWKSQVSFVQGDVLNQEDVERAAGTGVDRIVHAAVFTGIIPEIEKSRSRSIVEINLMGTTNMLELASRLSVDRFLYVSSGSVYGDGPDLALVVTEETQPQPRSLYAIGKHTSELLTRRYGELHGFQTVSVRLGTPYGPMERITGHRENQSLLKEWTANIINGEPIEIGDDDRAEKRSFTYVTDIANGVAAVLDAPRLSYDVYNNSSADSSSMADIIAVLQELRLDLTTKDVADRGLSGRASRMDATRMEQDVGFAAKFGLADGLQDYLAWREASGFTE